MERNLDMTIDKNMSEVILKALENYSTQEDLNDEKLEIIDNTIEVFNVALMYLSDEG